MTRSVRYIRRIALVGSLLVGTLLVYDFVKLEFDGRSEVRYPGPPAASYAATLHLENVRFDAARQAILAGVIVTVTAVAGQTDISGIAISIAEEPNKQRLWRFSGEKESCRGVSYTDVPNGVELSQAQFTCGDVVLTRAERRRQALYPFDRYEAFLSPMACVNRSDGLCLTANVQFTAASAEIRDTNILGDLEITGDGITKLVIHRKPFVRIVSVVFLVMSILFLVYLVQLSDPKDLYLKTLGLFGTLWGLRSLIVPSTIVAFPTVVDYAVLSLFVALFAVALAKLE